MDALKEKLDRLKRSNNKQFLINIEASNSCSSSIFVSNEYRNREDITLIWYDENIDVYDEPKKKIQFLQPINNYVVICSDMNTCSEYINQIRTEKLFIILSGRTANEMMEKIHDFKQVHSIYKFSTNDTCVNEYDKRKYDKLAGTYSELESLLETIQKDINSKSVTNLFGQYERSIRSLDSELHVFIEFCLFKYVLLKLDYDREWAKKEMIDACRTYYKDDSTRLRQVDDFEQNYHPNNAIRWYTGATFVYKLINQALRTEDYESLWTLRFFIIDLYENIRLKCEIAKQDSSTILTYRGCRCTPDDIYSLKYNIGKTIATNSFLSTSRSKVVAEMFSGQEIKEPGFETVILEFHIDTTMATAVFADIASDSFMEYEQEVLFAFGTTFTIDNVTCNGDENKPVWNVKLSTVSQDILTDKIQTILESFRDKDMKFIFAELLIKMGLYTQCQKYLNKLLDSYEDIARIKEFIAWSNEEENKYDQAIVYYEEAFNLFSSSNHWEDAARVTNLISLCYYKINDKDTAQQYNTKALDILKNQTNLPDNHCLFGKIMVALGDIEDDQSCTRNYFQKALDIFQNPSNTCKCQSHEKELAGVYELIAFQYRAEENYRQAIEYYQESEKLRSKHVTLREERMAYIRSLLMLSDSYKDIRDDDTAQMYFSKYYKFINNDLIELIYGNDLDAKEGVLSLKTTVHSCENQLLYELRLLQLLNMAKTKNYEQIIERHLNIGEIYTKAKYHDWAHEYYDKADELCQNNITSESTKAQIFFEIGRRSAVEDDIKYALTFANKALQVRLLILNNDDIDIGFSYYLLSVLYDYSKQYDHGIRHCQKAIEIFEENHEFRVIYQYAICCHLIASMYQKKQNIIKSIEYLSKTANYLECFLSDMNIATNFLEHFMFDMNIPIGYLERFICMSKMPDSYYLLATCYTMMAKNYQILSDNETSIIYHKKVLDTFEKYPKVNPLLVSFNYTNDISETYQSLAKLYWTQIDYDQSTFYYEKFVESSPINQDKIPMFYSTIGADYMNQKNYKKAIENYEKAINHFESQLPNQFNLYADCVMNMAMCYLLMGKSQIDNANKCLLKIIKNENTTILTYGNFIYGSIFILEGNYEMSINILNKALVHAQENKSLLPYIQKLLSHCFYEITDYQTAITYAKLSIENHEELNGGIKNEHSVSMYNIIAHSFFRLNNIKEALSNALTGQMIVDKLNLTLPVQIEKANIYSMLALIYSKQRNNRKADKHCKIALNICEQLIKIKDELIDIGGTFENLAKMFIIQNNFEKARIYYDEAVKSYQQQLVDDHPIIRRLQSDINSIPKIELQFRENMQQESQRTFIDYISEKSANIYRTFFSFD